MFILEYAKEIMFLCFGVGFLTMSFFITRSVIRIHSLLQKLDDLSDLFITYIQRPLSLIIQAHKAVNGIRKWFQ